MRFELVVALIAGAVALASAGGTIWSSIKNAEHAGAVAKQIEELKIADEQAKVAVQKQEKISSFSEPLARASYDLQSRLYNILRQNLISVYLTHGNQRERSYVINNTAFLIGQYLCWTELVRREIQFVNLGENGKTREFLRIQDSVYDTLGTDKYSPSFRIFAGEQRAIGEALIEIGPRGPECMGYGAFLKTFGTAGDPLIDSVRQDVTMLDNSLLQATERLTRLQHALIDLLRLLDPEYLRFPEARRSKS